MSKSILISGMLVFLVGCSSLPSVSVVDDLANEETRSLAKNSVWVVSADKARRFDDPAWPTPIQIVSPERNGSPLTGSYDVSLFDNPPSGQRIDVLYVIDGDEEACVAILSQIGVSASESAWVEVNSGGGQSYRCGSVVLTSSDSLILENPFITDSRKVEITSMRKSLSQERYPIKILYAHD